MELLRQVLEDKEKEIGDIKDWLRQVKKEAIREYHDSDALLAEFGGFFAKGFDECLRQVKASFLDLDLSHVTIDAQVQTLVQPVHSKSTDELFADDAPVDDPRADEEIAVENQIKPIMDSTHHPDDVQFVKEKDEDTPIQQ